MFVIVTAKLKLVLSQYAHPPKLSEEESASHSISSTSSSCASGKAGDATLVAAAAVSAERHEEALERLRSLEATVSRLQAENAALRVEPEWSSGLRSVQEEVSNVDVVRYVCGMELLPERVFLSFTPATLAG